MDYKLYIYNLAGRQIATFEPEEITTLGIRTVAWHPSGLFLAVGGWDDKVLSFLRTVFYILIFHSLDSPVNLLLVDTDSNHPTYLPPSLRRICLARTRPLLANRNTQQRVHPLYPDHDVVLVGGLPSNPKAHTANVDRALCRIPQIGHQHARVLSLGHGPAGVLRPGARLCAALRVPRRERAVLRATAAERAVEQPACGRGRVAHACTDQSRADTRGNYHRRVHWRGRDLPVERCARVRLVCRFWGFGCCWDPGGKGRDG